MSKFMLKYLDLFDGSFVLLLIRDWYRQGFMDTSTLNDTPY